MYVNVCICIACMDKCVASIACVAICVRTCSCVCVRSHKDALSRVCVFSNFMFESWLTANFSSAGQRTSRPHYDVTFYWRCHRELQYYCQAHVHSDAPVYVPAIDFTVAVNHCWEPTLIDLLCISEGRSADSLLLCKEHSAVNADLSVLMYKGRASPCELLLV